MIIVIEGCDGTGKTTLAREFEKRGFRYVHNGKPTPNEDLFETYTRQLLDHEKQNVVIDRLHVGEVVYGRIMRGTSRISTAQLRLLNRLLFGLGGVIILCNPPFAYALGAWQSRQAREYVGNEFDLESIYRTFNDIWAKEFADHYWCSLTYNPERWPDQAVSYANTVINLVVPRCPPGVTGSPRARYLIIGEQAGGPHDLAFYADRRSSAFLNDALWIAGYTEPELSFTNALTLGGETRNLRELYDRQSRRTVIALGRVAQQACFRQGVPHLPAEHPQFVKRFHLRNGGVKRYVDKLRRFREGK